MTKKYGPNIYDIEYGINVHVFVRFHHSFLAQGCPNHPTTTVVYTNRNVVLVGYTISFEILCELR